MSVFGKIGIKEPEVVRQQVALSAYAAERGGIQYAKQGMVRGVSKYLIDNIPITVQPSVNTEYILTAELVTIPLDDYMKLVKFLKEHHE